MANPHADNPLARDGHISYLEIPALEPQQSAAFYEAAFGWRISSHKPGQPSFEDGSGTVIGKWVACRAAVSPEPGLVPYIYVAQIDQTVARIVAKGGKIVKEPYPEGDIWVATFRDPAGNLIGVWQFGPR
jgi:uncharacterized protein